MLVACMVRMTINTAEGCLRGAWDALLRGDYGERDRLCDRAKRLAEAEQYASAVEKVMSIDFYVTPRGVSIPTLTMARAAGALQ